MKLITVEAAFPPDQTRKAVDAVAAQADSVRTMEGCTHYAVYRSDNAIAIVQKWTSMEAFDQYRGSAVFAGLIGTLKPLMTAPPVTTIADAVT